jgi:hypothetical protein
MPYSNPGETLLRGIQAGQQIRSGYEDHKGREATKKFFEKLRVLETPDPGGIPVSDSAGSEGASATMAAATGVIPTDGGAIQPKAKKKYKSFTQDDIDELNQLAASAATAGGDPKVYEALRGTARSYMQTKVLDQFRKAQVALQVGDEEGLEDALRAAYQYVPDGKDLKLKRNKEGKLMFRHPVSDDELPVNSEMLGLFMRGALDPVAFEETIYGRKKDKIEQGQKQQDIDIARQNAESGAIQADTGRFQQEETTRHNKAEEKQKATDSQADNLLKKAQALYYMNYAGYLGRDKGKGGATSQMNAQRQYAQAVNTVARQYIMPTQRQVTTDEFGGQKVIEAPAPRLEGFQDADEGTVNTISGYAEQIGIANPELGISQAVGAAAAIHRAMQGGGNVHVDPAAGLLGIQENGRMRTFKVPRELIQVLTEQAQGQ